MDVPVAIYRSRIGSFIVRQSRKFSQKSFKTASKGPVLHFKLLFIYLYRDWQYLSQVDHNSLDISEQMLRWTIFLDQWEKALDTGMECVVMGDFNLDFLTFYSSSL